MQDLSKSVEECLSEVRSLCAQLKLEELSAEYKNLEDESKSPNFWQSNQKAQATMKRLGQLELRIKPWQEVTLELRELKELIGLDDTSLKQEIFAKLKEIRSRLVVLKGALRFSGTYDDHNAIVSIYAGAGGTDAQDWTQMLLRMYVRWAEKKGFKVTTITQSPGDEAGIKSATIEIGGQFAYGLLRGEQGVHRLVRLSPFNADKLRQTSFAKVDILPEIDRPEGLEIDDKELKIDVYRAGGHGGQSVNTTDSAVRVTHIPTGITVAIQNERSQLQNKETALTILRSKLAALKQEQHLERLSDLKGPNLSAEWGNQIRSYVLHPYKQVKDLRTKYETSDTESVLDGDLDAFLDVYHEQNMGVRDGLL